MCNYSSDLNNFQQRITYIIPLRLSLLDFPLNINYNKENQRFSSIPSERRLFIVIHSL